MREAGLGALTQDLNDLVSVLFFQLFGKPTEQFYLIDKGALINPRELLDHNF
jgi:hypothetical protein